MTSPTSLRRSSRLIAAAVSSVTALLLLGAAPSAHAAEVGLNVNTTDSRVLGNALATGPKYVRMFVAWEKLEPDHAGQYPSATDNPGAANDAAQFDSAIKQINAAGAQPIFVVVGAPPWANGAGPGNNLVPPSDPSTYASFFARFVRHTASVGTVAAYEVWNEEDASEFWKSGTPGPAAYGPLLQATYAAAKPVAGNAAILVGPTTANNSSFINGLYEMGLKGSFDGVSVHTDTACLTNGPDKFIRDNSTGPINQYSFLGYRTLRNVMLAHSDGEKAIWMTELGWSSASGPCQRKAGGGDAGVSEASQATFLTRAFGCLAHDPYVKMGAWFTYTDSTQYSIDEINHYGLVDVKGGAKPSLAAFKKVAAEKGGGEGPCGDFTPPAITLLTPTDGDAFTKSIEVQAKATDGTDAGVTAAGMKQINFSVDGQAPFFRSAVGDGQTASKIWYGASALSDGVHTLTAQAFDQNGNATTKSVKICKGVACAAKAAYSTKIVFAKGKIPKCRARTCTVKGSLVLPAGKSKPAGRVRVEWQIYSKVIVKKNGKKRIGYAWKTYHKGGKRADKPFTFTQKLAKKGKWRVRVYYEGALPAKKSTSLFKSFRV
jgi:hypothetical protein